MNLEVASCTNIGLHRRTNEDALLVDDDLQLYLVCDGLGAHKAGEVAADKASRAVAEFLRARRDEVELTRARPGGHFQLMKLAEEAVQFACRSVFESAREQPKYAGMATTLTLAWVIDDKAIMAHVGDSRLYVLREDHFHLLSIDHSLSQELVAAGRLTPQQGIRSQFANVLTRTLGHQESVQVDTLVVDLFPGDTLLLCTDGLSRYLDEAPNIDTLLRLDDLDQVAGELMDLALSQGGRDNITCVVLRLEQPNQQWNGSWLRDVQDKLRTLRASFLCEGLSFSQLNRVLSRTQVLDYLPGETLAAQGETLPGMYVMISGRCVEVAGEAELEAPLYALDCLGQGALAAPVAAENTFRVTQRSRLLLLPRDRFQELCQNRPKLGVVLLQRLTEYLACRTEVEAILPL